METVVVSQKPPNVITNRRIEEEFNIIVDEIRRWTGVHLVHATLDFSDIPLNTNGQPTTSIKPEQYGGCVVDNHRVFLNPNRKAVMNYYKYKGSEWEFVQMILRHELSHVLYHNAATYVNKILKQRNKSSFSTSYLKTVTPDKYEEEWFCEYMAHMVLPTFPNPLPGTVRLDKVLNKLEKVKYGWIDRLDNVGTDRSDWWNTYKFTNPTDLLKVGIGTCYEVAVFIYDWLAANKYNPELIHIGHDQNHLFTIYPRGGKYYWVESSWDTYTGVHQFNNRKELIETACYLHEVERGDHTPVLQLDRSSIRGIDTGEKWYQRVLQLEVL